MSSNLDRVCVISQGDFTGSPWLLLSGHEHPLLQKLPSGEHPMTRGARGLRSSHAGGTREENKHRGSSSRRSPHRAASALPLPQQGWRRGGCISGSHCPGEVTQIWALTENATSLTDTRTTVPNRVKRKRKSPNPV